MGNFCRYSIGIVLLLVLFGRVTSQALGTNCSGTSTCDDTTNHVCEDDGAGTQLCKVKADGTKTDCASTNGNCPANAACATTVCNCNAGWIVDGNGLCTVQDADCSSDPCGDTTNYVCESNQCKVKADGSATSCAGTNGNCPANAACSTTVCNCNAGWIDDGTGVCTVQNADCASATCGETTNYVCDTSTNTCKVKADGSATSCASTDGNCPANAACSNTTCSCNAGYTQATGLCTAIVGSSCSVNSNCTSLGDANTECSSGSCACVSGYTNAGGGACAQSAAFKLTASGLGVYLCILLIALLI